MSALDNIKLLDGLNTMTESELHLNNVLESSKNTLNEALMFLHLVKVNLEHFGISNKEDAYAFNNVLATNLSISCELSLKALYLCEQQKSGKTVGELWSDLRNPKRINPNLVSKASGHSLNILVSHLSNEIQTLINYRVRMLDKELVDKYPDITFVDMLLAKGFVSGTPFMSNNEYDNDLLAHRETFVSSRYGGQAYSNPDIKFLYHLATQLSTIARFFIMPNRQATYSFNLSYYANKVPNEVIALYQIKPEYVTDDLIKLFVKRGDKKAAVLNSLLGRYRNLMLKYSIDPTYFYYMNSAFEQSEIEQVFESIPQLEAEEESDIVGFLNFCIMMRVIFKEKVESPEKVRFSFIDYVGLNKIVNKNKYKFQLEPTTFTIVAYKFGDLQYQCEGEGRRR